MRNEVEALKGALTKIKTAVSQGKYEVASYASTDFIKLSYNLEFKTGVFTGEVLEAICIEIRRTLHVHVIPDEDQKKLNKKMTEYLEEIIKDYNTQNSICDSLANMRYDATTFQFESDFKYRSSSQVEQILR